MTVKSLRLDWNSEGQKYLTEDFSGLWPAGEPSAPGEAPNLPCQKHQLHPSAPSCHHRSIPHQLQHSCCTSTSLLKAFRENLDKDLSTDTEHFSKKHEMFWRENPQPGSVSAAAVSVAAGKQHWRGHFTRSQAAWTCPRCFLFIPHFSLCIFPPYPLCLKSFNSNISSSRNHRGPDLLLLSCQRALSYLTQRNYIGGVK